MHSTFSDRFNEAREHSGIEFGSIAKKMGVSIQSVYGWSRGAVPRGSRITELADILGVSGAWLMYGATNERPSFLTEDGSIVVPMFDLTPSAGNGGFKDTPNIVKLMELDPAWVSRELSVNSKTSLFVATVKGDSMEPTLYNKDLILIDSSVNSVLFDGIYVTEIEDCYYVKRYQKIPGGNLLMISDNDFYKPFEIDPNKYEGFFTVVGKVVYSWHGNKR